MSRWKKIRFTVTTPLFSRYGADNADPFGIRIPELRGHLRFWFRALAGTTVGDNLGWLAKAETALFGSTNGQSDLQFRLPGPPALSSRSRCEWVRSFPGLRYLLGQGLYYYDKRSLACDYVCPYESGTLAVSCPDGGSSTAGACLWTLATFGGVGARVHRGFGGIRIDDEDLRELWTDAPRQVPTVENLEKARSVVGDFVRLVKGECRTREASYSHFGPNLRIVTSSEKSRHSDPILAAAGRALRKHRAREPYRGSRQGVDGVTREYLETVYPFAVGASARANRKFGLAAFGLPIVFPSRKAEVVVRCGDDDLRRASPVWIRPWMDPECNEWRVMTFVLSGPLIPEDGEIVLRSTEKPPTLEHLPLAKLSPKLIESRWAAWLDEFDGLVAKSMK